MNFLIYGFVTSIFLSLSKAEIASTNVNQVRTKNDIAVTSNQATGTGNGKVSTAPNGIRKIPSPPNPNLPPLLNLPPYNPPFIYQPPPLNRPPYNPPLIYRPPTPTQPPYRPTPPPPPSYSLGYYYSKPKKPFTQPSKTIAQAPYKPPNQPLSPQTQPLYNRPLPTQSPYKIPYRYSPIAPPPSYPSGSYSPKLKIPFSQKTLTSNLIGYNYPKPKIPFNLPSEKSVVTERGYSSSSGYIYNRPKIPFNLPNHL